MLADFTGEQLIVGFMAVIFTVMLINFIYIRSLNAFFEELMEKDPQTWADLGCPRPGDQYSNTVSERPPLFRVLGVLRGKAAGGDYPKAQASMRWFIIAGICTGLIFIAAAAAIVYLEFLR